MNDRETKFAQYQKAGVSEYWLVDYQAQTVELFNLQEMLPIQESNYPMQTVKQTIQASNHPMQTVNRVIQEVKHPIQASNHPIQTMNRVI